MLNNDIQRIKGDVAKDERGQIRFVNGFDMSAVKRFYIIRNSDIELIRGWRGHRIEQRWFYVLSGGFEFNIVKIDNWDIPAKNLLVNKIIVKAEGLHVLHIPAGYATAIRAIEPHAELLVYGDYGIEHAPQDDFTWELDYFMDLKTLKL